MDCDESLSEVKTIQDVPKFLSPELRDIFPIFASMLDIKSFMNLAMTSKDMYKRCMEDKAIKINVNENSVYGNDCEDFRFTSSLVSEQHIESYFSALKKLRCTVNLRTLEISNYLNRSSMIDSARRYLDTMGVERVRRLSLHYFSEWNALIPFIKDFHVDILIINDKITGLSSHVLRSLLQLNLKEFSYRESVPVDLLFEINIPIPRLYLIGIDNIPKDKFMQILWMIQSGSLTHLTLNDQAVDWNAYDKLPYDHEGPIPEDRPLLFTRTPENSRIYEYWFLHWQGGVTKCVEDGTLKVFKCEPYDLPLALRKEEDVMKDLKEMRAGVSCHLKHFRTFSDSLSMVDPSMIGPLPPERPLYFKGTESSFWRLNRHDTLMEYLWENDRVMWKPFIPRRCLPFSCPSLAKFLFWNLLKENTDFPFSFHVFCKSREEFDSWFEDYETLDYDYTGPLPNDRPLVFGGPDRRTRYVLFEDVWFEISYTDKEVHVEQYGKRHLRGITHKTIKEILQNTSSHCVDAYVNIRVSLKTFRYALELFESGKRDCGRQKTFRCVLKPFESESVKRDGGDIVWKSMKQIDGVLTVECWYCFRGVIRKVVWSEGRMVKTPGHLQEAPAEFVKMLFKEFATQGQSPVDMFLELEQFHSCLEQFTVILFDYCGPLKTDFPLVFVKEEIRHTCDDDRRHCQCPDVAIHVRFQWERMRSTHCSWGEEEPKKIAFKSFHDSSENMPAALKAKEYLKTLLEASYDRGSQYEWLGEIDDFLAFFDDFKKLSFDYKGDLPKERPLVFEDNSDAKEPVRFYFREDNSIVKCSWGVSRGVALLSLHQRRRFAPPATWKFL